jgi:hypothetical protein
MSHLDYSVCAIFVAIIRHAFFKGAVLYFAIAYETIDIFLNNFLLTILVAFFVGRRFFLLKQKVDFPVGRSSTRVRSRTRDSIFSGIFLFQIAAQ